MKFDVRGIYVTVIFLAISFTNSPLHEDSYKMFMHCTNRFSLFKFNIDDLSECYAFQFSTITTHYDAHFMCNH